MLSHFHLIPERHGQTDGRTDRQICYINIARQYANARQKDCLFCGNNSVNHVMMIGHLLSEGGTRVEFFHAADCVYHKSCNVNFCTFRGIRRQHRLAPENKRKKVGRPTNSNQEQAFYKMCTYFEENDEEQLTITDLSNKMKE